MEQVLEGFEAYIATGFEEDGGSIEGIGYWNYGLMYYVTLAELLRERTGGQIDLLAQPRMKDIARYPLVTALSPGTYVNFGDATEKLALQPGIVCNAGRAHRRERPAWPVGAARQAGGHGCIGCQAGDRAARPAVVGWQPGAVS